jgi:elongation factor 1-beta
MFPSDFLHLSYEVSDKDVEAFNALPSGPNEAAFPHAARWYKHIAAVKGLSAKYATFLF